MRYASIKPIHKANLTLPDGKTVEVERIGRGRYTTAWANGSRVYLQTHEKDFSKEILSAIPRNPHIPECEHLGGFSGPFRLYSMPLYRKVTARDTPEAWRHLRCLEALREEADGLARQRARLVDGYALNDAVRAILDDMEAGVGTLPSEALPWELFEAVRSLLDEAANYGEYTVEFSRRNVAADARGRLVLIDPLFDMAEVRQSREGALRKARGY
jgi:hypothetical protein